MAADVNENRSTLIRDGTNESVPTQEVIPKSPPPSNGLIEGFIPFESHEEAMNHFESMGLDYCYDSETGRVREVDANGNVSGIVPASEEVLKNYVSSLEEQNAMIPMNGEEIMEYAKQMGYRVMYDWFANKPRFADSSGKLLGVLPPSSVGLSSKGPPDTGSEDNSLGYVDMGQAVEAMNKLAETPLERPPVRSVSPMPTIKSFSQNIPAYGGGGKQRITAAMLKNKLLNSCKLIVKDGVIFNYDGRCYKALDESKVKQLIMAVCGKEVDEYGRFEIVTGAVNFILSEPSIQLLEELVNHRILTFLNGNLDIETGAFLTHDPTVFTTYTLQCNYIPNSCGTVCPTFDRYLLTVSGGDSEIVNRIWEVLGYCLVPDIGAKVGFVLQGRKHSGKTLLCNFLEKIFPQNVVSGLPAHNLAQKFALSELEGKALCVSGDMSEEPLKSRVVADIKKLSGNDLISADKKYQDNRQFRFGGKLILVSNHQILTQTDDDAFWDRLVAIPFPNTIPREQQDTNLLHRLMLEKDAIVSRAIEAYWKLRSRNYAFSGDYLINSGSFLLDSYESGRTDMRPLVQGFLLQHFESAPYEEAIFMSDAHSMFQQSVGSMPLNQFGLHFGNMATGILGAKKGKTRRKGEVNADRRYRPLYITCFVKCKKTGPSYPV